MVKNKLSAPFKVVNLEIIFGHGISTEGLLIDLAMEAKIITRSGAWFYYNGEQIAQGKEKVREILASDTKMRLELEIQIRENLNMGGIDKVKEELNEYLESQKNKDDKTVKSDKKEDGDLNKNSISNKDDTSDLLIKTVE